MILPEINKEQENINPIQEIIQVYDPLEYKALELGKSPIEKFPLIVVDADFGNAVVNTVSQYIGIKLPVILKMQKYCTYHKLIIAR